MSEQQDPAPAIATTAPASPASPAAAPAPVLPADPDAGAVAAATLDPPTGGPSDAALVLGTAELEKMIAEIIGTEHWRSFCRGFTCCRHGL